MKRIYGLLGAALALGVGLGSLGTWRVNAQEKENLKGGKLLQRTTLKAAPEWEAILVDRTLPPGAESGKHTQSGNEIVYIQDGAVTLEVEGKAPATIKAGEAFTTSAGQVHNVKNASSSEPAKALAFYIAKKGARLEDLSLPAK